MRKYFDKDFFRFLMGFVAIICTSIIILLASRLYQDTALIDNSRQSGTAIKSVER